MNAKRKLDEKEDGQQRYGQNLQPEHKHRTVEKDAQRCYQDRKQIKETSRVESRKRAKTRKKAIHEKKNKTREKERKK